MFKALYIISILVNVAYFAIRIVYIVTGRVKVSAPEDASESQLDAVATQNKSAVIYSSIVLVAELGGFVLVHVGQQMFTRQRTQFAEMTADNVSKMAQVRSRFTHSHFIWDVRRSYHQQSSVYNSILLDGAAAGTVPWHAKLQHETLASTSKRLQRSKGMNMRPDLCVDLSSAHAGVCSQGQAAAHPHDSVHILRGCKDSGAVRAALAGRTVAGVCRAYDLRGRRWAHKANGSSQARICEAHA